MDVGTLERIGAILGETERSIDNSVVSVRTRPGLEDPDIELIRGRPGKEFFPRDLLREAAKLATRKGNLLLYPLEFVVVLKADAAVDREERSRRDPHRAAENLRRAEAFRADVFAEVNRAMLSGNLDGSVLGLALTFVKKSRQDPVRRLLEAAGAAPAD